MEYGYCNVCKKAIESSTGFKFFRGKKICLTCYESTVAKTQTNSKHRKQLEKYICELFGFEEIPIPYIQQIDKFIKEYKFTPKGIEGSLYYFYEILENNVANDVYLGIVPRVYEESKQYFQELNKVIEINKNFVKQEETKVVKIKKPDGTISSKTSIEGWD